MRDMRRRAQAPVAAAHGRILHRDVSVNNIVIALPSSVRANGCHCFLAGLDRDTSVPECTSTFEFLSTDMLLSYPSRPLYHEFQSRVLGWAASLLPARA
jgi:hypothetical protein